jgi:hypothetical protein
MVPDLDLDPDHDFKNISGTTNFVLVAHLTEIPVEHHLVHHY